MENQEVRLIDLLDDMCAGKDVFFRFVRVASDIMPRTVKTLTMDDSLKKGLQFMQDNKVRHIPIMDPAIEDHGKPRFVGVISDRDLLRQMSPNDGKDGGQDQNQKAMRQRLGQIVTRNPISISPETTIPEILTCLVDNHIDMVPVVVEGDVVSVVTATDIIKLFIRLDSIRQLWSRASEGNMRRLPDLLAGGSAELTEVLSSILRTVQNAMSSQVVALQETDTVAEAMDVMKNRQFRHVPIVNKEGSIRGIVSDRDVLLQLPYRGGQRVRQSHEFRDTLFEVEPNHPSLKLPLKQIMASDPITVSPEASLYQVSSQLYESGISCLIVTDEQRKLLGIVTVLDVIKALIAAYRLIEEHDQKPADSESSAQEPVAVSS